MISTRLSWRGALCAGLLCAAVPGLPVPARAQTETPSPAQAYDVPAQELGSALARIARQGGLALSIDASVVAGKASQPVRGVLTAEQALRAALRGSGLRLDRTASGALTVAPDAPAEVAQLEAVQVTGLQAAATTEDTRSYTARSQATSARLALSPRETPQTVSTITRQQMEDRNLATLAQAMEAAPGVTNLTRAQGGVHYTARGFEMTGNMIDGMPSVGSVDTGYEPNLAFYDRVEIVRGAAGLVYGAGSPGGAVNLVRKRPTPHPQFKMTARHGSWDNNYLELDGSTPFNASGSVRGRAVVAYLDRENFVEDEFTRVPALYGIVEADIGATRVYAGGSRERWRRNMAVGGLPRYADGGDLDLPRSSRGMAPGWTEFRSSATTLFAGLEHRFDDRWKLQLSGTYQRRLIEDQRLFNASGAVDRDTLQGPAFDTTLWAIDRLPQRNRALDAMLTGAFDAWGYEHELVLGASWWENNWGMDDRWAMALEGPSVPGNIFDFDPSSIPEPAELGRLAEGTTVNSSLDYYGVARLRVAEPLRLILGGRVSSTKAVQRMDGHVTGVSRERNVFTPFAGLVYDLSDTWSAYASYAEIFRVQNTQYTASGSPLPPVVGASYEAGVKGEFRDGRLNVGLAVFRIDENNRAQVDPDNQRPCAGSPSGGDCYLASGKVRGQGFEAEVSGELAPGWDIVAGYTFVNTRYLRDRDATGGPSANEGKPFRSTTPRHLFKLWTSYRLPGAAWRWTVGGGVQAQSRIYTESNGVRVEQGGYAVWSLRAGYDFGEHWQVALNINNVFDRKYYSRLGSAASGNYYGEPYNWMVSLRGSF